MAVRATYQFAAPSGNDGGLILAQSADIKGRRTNGALVWLLDLGASNDLNLGDTAAFSGVSVLTNPRGGFGWATRTISGNTTLTIDDCAVYCNTAGGDITATLPALSTVKTGQILILKKTSTSNSLTITPNGTDQIEGVNASIVYGSNAECILQSDGTVWRFIRYPVRHVSGLSNFAPSATTTSSSFATLDSFTTNFGGRRTMFYLSGSMRNNNGSNEYSNAPFALNIDGGSDTVICEWESNLADNHQNFSGTLILTPTLASHTINLRWRRQNGAGTMTFDANDWYTLTMTES